MSLAPRLTLRGLELWSAGVPRPLLGVDELVMDPGLVAIVGASGAGKSLLGRVLVGQHHVRPGLRSGSLQIGAADPIELGAVPRGRAPAPQLISWACQHGRAALVPQWTVGRHLAGEGPGAVRDRLARLGLPAEVLKKYPHELSGGMAQRAHLAVALAGDPAWLVADEVTTGLDASAAQWVCAWLAERCRAGRGVVLISHDLGLIKDHADTILVMDQGAVVERGPATNWDGFRHPAARRLIDAAARWEAS